MKAVIVHVVPHWYCGACHHKNTPERVPHLEQGVKCEVCGAQFVVQEVRR